MNDNPLDDQLTGAFERLAGRAPHEPDLAGVVRQEARRVRRRRLTIAAAGLAVVTVAGVGGLRLLPEPSGGGGRLVEVAPAGAPQCHSTVVDTVLPEWARAGFSDPEPVMPYVRSASGNIVAILFTGELSSPPRRDVANKVLWTWENLPNPADLRVSARLDGTGPVTTAGLPSPAGPSYVDLPSPGCWRLTITWPGGRDTVDLQYVAPGT